MNRQMRALAAASLLCLAGGLASPVTAAEIVVDGPVVEGLAGANVTAAMSFAVGVNASYQFTGFDILLSYVPSELSLKLDSSTIQFGGAPAMSYAEFLGTLSSLTGVQPEFLGSHDPLNGTLTMSASIPFDVPFVPLDGPVVLNAVFRIADGLPVGTSSTYSVTGALYSPAALDPLAPEFLVGDTIQFSSAVSVTAVPEPHTWAMLLGGVALMAGVARRRVLHHR